MKAARPMTSEMQTQLLAEPKEVDVVSIERELTRLWKDARLPASQRGEPDGQATDGAPDSGSAPVVRACAMNLIVVTEDDDEAESLAEMVGDVTIEHPARIFLVCADRRAATPTLDAWVSARCSMPVPGGKQVCCEQIMLTAHGTEASKIPSIITSLLVPDVPGVLLWKPAVDEHDRILEALSSVVNRIIIDSSEDLSPERGLLAWQRFIREHGAHATFGDLAWTHLTAWRSVVANAFNPPTMRTQLASIDSVTVEYSSTALPRHSGLSQAMLLVSWLALKLKWTTINPLQANGTTDSRGIFRRGDQGIDVRITPVAAREGVPGGIESVTVHLPADTGLRFAATNFAHCMLFSKLDAASSSDEMLTVMHEKSEAMLVARELEVVTRDPGYEAVLNTLSEICNPLECQVERFTNVEYLQQAAARCIVRLLDEAIRQSGRATLVFSGGSTPGGVYKLLASDQFRSGLEWSAVHVFWGDERCVPPTDSESNYRMTDEALLQNVPIPQNNIHRIQAEQPPRLAAEFYEQDIRTFFRLREHELPRFDVTLLGMGDDGHVASLFPGTTILNEATRLVSDVFVPKLNAHRISMTYPVINNSHAVLFMIAGSNKAAVLRDVLEGEPARYPAQRVQPVTGNLYWFVDQQAASLLRRQG